MILDNHVLRVDKKVDSLLRLSMILGWVIRQTLSKTCILSISETAPLTKPRKRVMEKASFMMGAKGTSFLPVGSFVERVIRMRWSGTEGDTVSVKGMGEKRSGMCCMDGEGLGEGCEDGCEDGWDE